MTQQEQLGWGWVSWRHRQTVLSRMAHNSTMFWILPYYHPPAMRWSILSSSTSPCPLGWSLGCYCIWHEIRTVPLPHLLAVEGSSNMCGGNREVSQTFPQRGMTGTHSCLTHTDSVANLFLSFQPQTLLIKVLSQREACCLSLLQVWTG